MKLPFFSILSLLFVSASVWSCKDADPETNVGQLRVAFDNVVGNEDLQLNTGTYTNGAGESFTVTKFNYFISNVRLKKADGSEYVVPQDDSYFLIQEDQPTSQLVTLNNVPAGDYTGMSFMIGVDSLRSTMDNSRRTGVLDPGQPSHDGMYWEWNSGYIFLKMEGTSTVAPATQNNKYFYHIGGFGGGFDGQKTINNLRTTTMSFGNDAVTVRQNASPTVQLKTDILKIFNGSTPFRIAEYPSVMFATFSAKVADNYTQMFSYDHTNTTK